MRGRVVADFATLFTFVAGESKSPVPSHKHLQPHPSLATLPREAVNVDERLQGQLVLHTPALRHV
jgi:hypothetical protein